MKVQRKDENGAPLLYEETSEGVTPRVYVENTVEVDILSMPPITVDPPVLTDTGTPPTDSHAPLDTATPDTDTNAPVGDTGADDVDDKSGCGCNPTRAAPGWVALALGLALVRRMRPLPA